MVIANGTRLALPFDDSLFENASCCVALGDPGSGKSTALKKLVLDYVEQARGASRLRYSTIPILIPLRLFARERNTKGQGYSLLDFMYEFAKGSLSAACSRGFFEHFLEEGECLVCFDGLDEVTASGQRQEVRDIVESFVRRYPRNRYIITSRVAGYDQAPLSRRLFPHYVVQPLSEEEIRLYVTLWYQAREKSPEQAEALADELIERVMGSARLRDLAKRPLLLAIIALVHRIEAELPHERVKLYDKCSEALLTTLDAARKLERTGFEAEYFKYRREILEAVAFWMQAELAEKYSREVMVGEADLRLFVAKTLHENPTFALSQIDAWQQADSFIQFAKERTGLLIERGEKEFAFVHLTFQEYFAASFIWRTRFYNLDKMWELVEPHLIDPAWREVLLLLIGKLNEFARVPTLMVERIVAATIEDESILCRGLSLATSCLADNIRMEVSLQKRIIEKWLCILRAPLCVKQADMALAALNTVKQQPIVRERLQELAMNTNESAKLRVDIVTLYVGEEDAPDWVLQVLSDIAHDQTAPEQDRSRALVRILGVKSWFDQARRLVFEIMNTDYNSASICASALVGYLEHAGGKFLNRLLSMETQMPDSSSFQEEGLRLPWWKEDLVRFIEIDPRFTVIFRDLGWEDAWLYLTESIRKSTQVSELLGKLFAGPVQLEARRRAGEVVLWYPLRIAPKYRDMMAPLLLDVAKSISSSFIKGSILIWLDSLDYPPQELFGLVPELDAQFNIDMIPFFRRLLGSVGEADQLPNTDAESKLSEAMVWAKGIAEGENDFVKISFFKAFLSSAWRERAKAFALRLVEEGVGPGTGWAIAKALIENRPPDSRDDDIQSLLRLLLVQAEDHWTKGYAADCLQQLGLLDSQTTIDILLKVANQEGADLFTRVVLAHQAAMLGAREMGAQILREVITGTHADAQTKNAAFDALREIVAPYAYEGADTDYKVVP